MNLLSLIREQFRPVLAELVPDPAKVPEYLALIKPAQNPEHGDYQANFAMPLAKLLKKQPREVAAEVVKRLPESDMLEPPTVAGPGFINLRIKPEWLATNVRKMAADERLGIGLPAKPRTYVIDYSAPNVAKPLHVGHLRSTIIGDALARMLRFLGHRAIADNHLGDWGTQFGMLLYGYKNFRDEAAYEKAPVRELSRLYVEVRNLAHIFSVLSLGYQQFCDPAVFPANPIAEFARVYPLAQRRVRGGEDDEEEAPKAPNPVAEAYRQETVKLHTGDPDNVRLWNEFMPHCMNEIHAIYRRLDVHFDHEYGESFYHPMLAAVVKDLLERGIAQESQGAVIVLGEGDAVSLIQKRDGAFTYTTTDLATIKYRMETWQPDAILYVVDFRQAGHFKNLFETARRWGYEKVELEHISFGSVLGEDRKPIQTRKGGGTELQTLLDEAVDLGHRKYLETCMERYARGEEVPELTAEERRQIAEAVGIGAVKYADLSQNRTSDYVFSYDKMLATEGNTATYMQYAYARCRSIFRKGDVDETRFRTDPPRVILETPHERALALQLLRFGDALHAAATEYLPHLLTSYLWDLTKAYSGFFVNCPVLKAETPELRDSRLLLCDLTARVVQKALSLLGIQTVERM